MHTIEGSFVRNQNNTPINENISHSTNIEVSQLLLKASETQIKNNRPYRMQPQHPRTISDKELKHYLKIVNNEQNLSGPEFEIANYLKMLTKKTKQEILSAGNNPEAIDAILASYREEVGSIIYLADENPKKTAGLLNINAFRDSSQSIRTACDADFKKRSQQLEDFFHLQKQSLFPNQLNSFSIRMTITFAQMLITKRSFFNAMLVPKLIHYFIPEETQTTPSGNQDLRAPFKKRIEDVLLTLMNETFTEEKSNIQERFREIELPSENDTQAYFRSSLMVKTILGMSKNAPITQRDCAVAVLFHLLGWSRQAETCSCSAEWLQIKVLAERLDVAFSDAKSLISHGALFRMVNGKKEAFEFTPSLPNSVNTRTFGINSEGIIYNLESTSYFSVITTYLPLPGFLKSSAPVYFWETPAYQAVIKIWGIPEMDQKTLYEDVLSKLLKSTAPCSMTNLISLSAEVWCAQQSLSPHQHKSLLKELLITGNYAAESLNHNPIQRAWVDAAATFQEASNLELRNFSRAIQNSTIAAIDRLITDVDKKSDEYIKIQNQFGDWFISMSKIQYIMSELKQKKEERFGLYVLHEKNNLIQPGTVDSGKPVNTQKKFQRFAKKALDRVVTQNLILGNINKEHSIILNAFEKAIKNENFIPQTEAEFQAHVNTPSAKGITQYPWRFWDRGNLSLTYEVCMNSLIGKTKTSTVYPKQIMDLVVWYLTGLYSYCCDNNDWTFQNTPPYMSGAMQGHDFNWLIGDPSTLPLIYYMKENNCDAETAFNALLLPAAQNIYNLKVSSQIQQTIFSSIKQIVDANILIKKLPNIEDLTLLYEELLSLEKKSVDIASTKTLGGLCNEILNTLNKKFTSPEAQELLNLEMTAYIAKNLDDNNFHQWMAPAILAADSNWMDETGVELRKVCFFMAISPVTLLPFIGEINDLKTRTPRFNPLPNASSYYAMFDLSLKGLPNPCLI